MTQSSGLPHLKRLFQRELVRQRNEMNTVLSTSVVMVPLVLIITVGTCLMFFFASMALVILPLSNLIVPSESHLSDTSFRFGRRRAFARLLFTTRVTNFTNSFFINPLTYVTSFNIFLGLLLLIVCADPRPIKCSKPTDKTYKLIAMGGYTAMLGLSYGTTLVKMQTSLFWLIYSVLALVIMIVLIKAHIPNIAYYSNLQHTRYQHWWTQPAFPTYVHALLSLLLVKIGSPFGFLLDSCEKLITNQWLWKGLNSTELETIFAVLTALGNNDERRVRSILASKPNKISGQVIHILNQLDLASPKQHKLQLTARGEKFMQAAMRT